MAIYEAIYSGMRAKLKDVGGWSPFSDGEQVHDGYEKDETVERFKATNDDEALARATSKDLTSRLGLATPVLEKLYRLEEVKFEVRAVKQ